MLYTLDLTQDQLDRVYDRVTGTDVKKNMRIIHVLYDDTTDHYIALVDCDAQTATLLYLLMTLLISLIVAQFLALILYWIWS